MLPNAVDSEDVENDSMDETVIVSVESASVPPNAVGSEDVENDSVHVIVDGSVV